MNWFHHAAWATAHSESKADTDTKADADTDTDTDSKRVNKLLRATRKALDKSIFPIQQISANPNLRPALPCSTSLVTRIEWKFAPSALGCAGKRG